MVASIEAACSAVCVAIEGGSQEVSVSTYQIERIGRSMIARYGVVPPRWQPTECRRLSITAVQNSAKHNGAPCTAM